MVRAHRRAPRCVSRRRATISPSCAPLKEGFLPSGLKTDSWASFDGTGLREMPIRRGRATVYFVSEAPDGSVGLPAETVAASYRLEGADWTRIELPLSINIYRMVALDARSAVFCGARGGLCARLADGELSASI